MTSSKGTTMDKHEVTIAGVTDKGHYYCTCGRKAHCVRYDNGRPIWNHTSGTKRIDGRSDGPLVLDSRGDSITVDAPNSSESFVRVAGVPFES